MPSSPERATCCSCRIFSASRNSPRNSSLRRPSQACVASTSIALCGSLKLPKLVSRPQIARITDGGTPKRCSIAASVARCSAASLRPCSVSRASEVSDRYCAGVRSNSGWPLGTAFGLPGMTRSGSDKSGFSPRVASSKVAREMPSASRFRPERLDELLEFCIALRMRGDRRRNHHAASEDGGPDHLRLMARFAVSQIATRFAAAP